MKGVLRYLWTEVLEFVVIACLSVLVVGGLMFLSMGWNSEHRGWVYLQAAALSVCSLGVCGCSFWMIRKVWKGWRMRRDGVFTLGDFAYSVCGIFLLILFGVISASMLVPLYHHFRDVVFAAG